MRPMHFGLWLNSLKIGCLLLVVIATNHGVAQRIELLWINGRWETLVPFIGLWVLSMFALLCTAWHPSLWVRMSWGVLTAAAGASAYSYYSLSGSELSPFDVLSLWSARHEAGRAFQFYYQQVPWFVGVFAVGFAGMVAPPGPVGEHGRTWLKRLVFLPALPIAAIAVIVLLKQGGGSEGLPRQSAQISIGLVAALKIEQAKTPQRSTVQLTPGPREIDDILFVVDESVRGDYLDWTPGNPYTPGLPRLKDELADFGVATSGGNCSAYSNAILRFAASPRNLTNSIRTSPGLFRYAKRAGYRTVFIDAQATINRNPGLFQNFMTKQEAADIDGYYTFPHETPTADLDFKLLEVVKKELASGVPVFIYANKNGAHFPYDTGYPADRAVFHPTLREAGLSTEARIGSYRNAILWSVDLFMTHLLGEANLSKAAVIYTSDHGQVLENGKLTHCSVAAPDPREGLVPLLAMSGNGPIQARFKQGAAQNFDRATHFAIAPTLLELMGYRPADLHTIYTASLFEPITDAPGFTSGDVFGIFSDKYYTTALDRARRWLESPGVAASGSQTARR